MVIGRGWRREHH